MRAWPMPGTDQRCIFGDCFQGVLVACAVLVAGCRTSGSDGTPLPTDSDAPEAAAPGLDSRPANPGCLGGPRPVDPTATIALDPVFPELSFERAIAVSPPQNGSERWYVAELKRSVYTWLASDPAGSLTVALDVTALASTAESQWGILSMALHPDFPDDPRGFFYYRVATGDTEISAVSADRDGVFDIDTREVILTIDQIADAETHVGGHLAFSPRDGHLYLSLGDGSDATHHDDEQNAQDPTDLRGSMLRLDIDQSTDSIDIGAAYRIPADNPFAEGEDGAPEVYAWGLRNPWRFSFDRETGALWLGDVGADCWEEINQIERGGNYGWNLREGNHEFDINSPDNADDSDGCSEAFGDGGAGMEEPVWEYLQVDTTRSVTGGFIYRGADIPALTGHYIFADYRSGRIWGLSDPDSASATPVMTELFDSDLRISSWFEDADGALYVVSYDFWNGLLYRLVAAEEGDAVDPFPTRLSETGCVDPTAPAQPAEGLVPYSVNAPLWSDGAAKQRWVALPDGAVATIEESGHLSFPAGTVLMKEFSVGDIRVETRLFARHDDGSWAGYTYAWNDAQDDATLVPAGRVTDVAGSLWQYPSPNQCLDCHTSAAGWSLGLEVAQLNRDWTYPSTGRTTNQLWTWDAIGLLDAGALGVEPAELPEALPALVGLEDPETEAAVRSYLHSNCAPCHRPGSTYEGTQDFRYDISLDEMSLCGVAPAQGDLGLAGASLVAPGDPERSILLVRMESTDVHRMPPIGSLIAHEEAVARVRQWINSMRDCPD